MKIIRIYLILLIVIVFHHNVLSQFFFPVKDSTHVNKLTSPFLNRPLTLYKKQLQVETSWEYYVLYNRYNENKEIVNLAQTGETSFRQDFDLKLDYGITNNLQAGVVLGYTNALDKNMEKLYIDPGSLFQYSHKLNIKTETKGIKDVSLSLRYLMPFRSKTFSLAIECGTNLLISNSEIKQPDTINSLSKINIITFVYSHEITRYNSPTYGSFCGNIKLIGRVGRNKLAGIFDLGYKRGLAEKKINDWSSDLYFKKTNTSDLFTGEVYPYQKLQGFNVNKTSYNYSFGNYFTTNIYLAWQIKPYFVTKLGMDAYLRTGSYKKYESNTAYLPDEYNLMAFAAYELQVTPRLRFQQSISGTFAGMNTKIPLIIYTSLLFNVFL